MKVRYTVTEGFGGHSTMHGFDDFADALRFYTECCENPRRNVDIDAHFDMLPLARRPGQHKSNDDPTKGNDS